MSRFRSDIVVITTGGTIDAEPYASTPDNVDVGNESRVPEAFSSQGITGEIEFKHLFHKDSKEITQADLEAVAAIIIADSRQCFIVTHGTDTMPENSRKLAGLLYGVDKKVVVTGSMTPLSHGAKSDGYKNLKVAVDTLNHWSQHSENVQVVMGGKVWQCEGLIKDFDNKSFYYKKNPFSPIIHHL